MQALGDLFHVVFFAPIVNLIAVIINFLNNFHFPWALGIAIIAVTLIIRLLLWPLMSSQIRSSKKIADLKPELDALKIKHKGDKQALSNAQMALYKQHGINPMAGCLPTILQFPILIALYQVLLSFFQGEQGLININNTLYSFITPLSSIPDTYFLFFNLVDKPSDFMTIGTTVLLIPLVTALLTFIQAKMMLPQKPLKILKDDKKQEVKEKLAMDDAMSTIQTQMVYLMPAMIGYFAFTFPAGLSLYWNIMTVIGIVQQYKIGGWGGMTPIITKLRLAK